MSSEKFELSQDELDTLLERLATTISQLPASSSNQPEARKRTQQACLSLLEEGSGLVEEMDSEARTAPLQYRAEMLASVRSYRSRLSLMQSSYHKEIRSDGGATGRLTGGGGSEAASAWAPTDGYRERVLVGTRTLERTGESLHRATQVAVETEVIGGAIIEDLGSQREALERTRNRLIETDLELSKSRRLLRKMYLNVISNKIILLCIILSELGILGGLVYWKFFSK